VTPVLVLNADYSILEIVDWQKAVSMLVREKVRLVEAYAGRVLRSATETFEFPAVVVRTKYVSPKKTIRLSRKNVLARDNYTCQYCSARPLRSSGRPALEDLTIDHVVPRAQGVGGYVTLPWSKERVRVTSWKNLHTSCIPCNSDKADRTPDQAGMKMKRIPREPTLLDAAWMALTKVEIPEEWASYLPEESPWRNYWSVELDPS
jgi:5-methylcytosine-specific restriction endonuclease McrA